MYIYTTDYLHEEYMCNKTWLMFYCRRDEHDNYFNTRKGTSTQ